MHPSLPPAPINGHALLKASPLYLRYTRGEGRAAQHLEMEEVPQIDSYVGSTMSC